MTVLPVTMFYKSRRLIEEEQLAKANDIVTKENSGQTEIITKEELEENKNIIGILEIPKLKLVAPIQEGTGKEILKVAVGHFSESSFWNGNVALASHNRSQYAHYFEKINELQKDDEIIYKTKMGTRKYIVCDNKVIESKDWSVVENTKDNVLTLITCLKGNTGKRLCVRAKECKETTNKEQKTEEVLEITAKIN